MRFRSVAASLVALSMGLLPSPAIGPARAEPRTGHTQPGLARAEDAAARAAATARARGVKVVGSSDLGSGGLNHFVDVLGDHAFVGYGGPNGGFAAEWNKTPNCGDVTNAGSVKVVSLADPANPEVVSNILIGDRRNIARDVAVLRVEDRGPGNSAFTGDLLAIGIEHCNVSTTGRFPGIVEPGRAGVDLYDVTDPSLPVLLGSDDRSDGTFQIGPRGISMVQQVDGRVLLFEANHATGANNGVHIVDVTDPSLPTSAARFVSEAADAFSKQECRPFNYPQGVDPSKDGTRAYVAYEDAGLYVLDISELDGGVNVLGQKKYAESAEGNSFRFIPNAAGTRALVTDEDLLPARTSLTITSGPASKASELGGVPGVFRACEAVWGEPLFTRSKPEINTEILFVGGLPGEDGGLGCEDGTPPDTINDYEGIDAEGKIVLTFRGCGFNENAETAQRQGASALLIANTGVPIFSPDSLKPADAGINIPVAMITEVAGVAIAEAARAGKVQATLADKAHTWGALRIFDITKANPKQTAVFNAPRTKRLTPGEGLYYAMGGIWKKDQAIVAWMSDGLRVVDVAKPGAPKGRAFFVPPAAPDPTGNYGEVPLVVDVAQFGKRFVAVDINGGLFVLDVILARSQCKGTGWKRFGFDDRAACVGLFRDGPAPTLRPGRISDLKAKALSASKIQLTFSAPGTQGSSPPPATRYIVKQSRKPITDAPSFRRARSLCGGICVFGPNKVGDLLRLTVTGLSSGSTYHYSIKATAEGKTGKRSNTTRATTRA